MKKTLLNSIFLIFLGLFLFSSQVFAKQTFNFDKCQLNQQIDQCYSDFISGGSWAGKVITTNDFYFSSPYSGKNNSAGNGGFEFIRVNLCPNYATEKRHRIDFKFRYNSFQEDYIDINVMYSDGYYSYPPIIQIRPQRTTYAFTTTTIGFYDGNWIYDTFQLLANTWYELKIFSYIDNNQVRHFKVTITNTENNSKVFEKEYTTPNNLPIIAHYINIVKNYHRFDDFVYYCQDDITETGQEKIEYQTFNTAGWIDENFFVDILQTIKQFNPPYPNKPYYIVPTSTDIYFKASFINASTLNLYRPTKLIFYSRASGTENTINLNLPWLGQGSTSTNINITQLRNFFANNEDILEMKLEIQRRNLMTAGMWVVDTFYFPLPTAPPIFLALKENPEQLIIIQEGRTKPPEREEYLVPLTDCSQAQNLLENVSCEIRNLLIEVFVPKKKSLELLENQMNILSNKFPFNVFLTIKNFFGDIVNSLQDTAKVKMFNKEVSLSADFYNSIPVISTLYQGMRLLFNLFVVFMFIKVLKWEVEVLIHSIT